MIQIIDSYSFGRLSIGKQIFTADLIIYPNGKIKGNWWRNQGHNLILDDIADLIDQRPEMLIVGTGAHGLMRISDNVLKQCQQLGILVEACPTAMAVEKFNAFVTKGKNIAACFHLTC